MYDCCGVVSSYETDRATSHGTGKAGSGGQKTCG
jgi:hypothetical protein